MTTRPRLPLPCLALAAILLGTLTVNAGTAGVQDNAGFFSEAAKADAGRTISEIQRAFHKDVLVETFSDVPADVRQGVNLQDKTAAVRMFNDWAQRQFRQKGVDGVYIQIVKNPAHLKVVVGNETQKVAFTAADREALASLMLEKLRAKNNDGALRDGVALVASTMRSHAAMRSHSTTLPTGGYRNASQPQSSGGWLLPVLLIVGVIWVVKSIIGALTRGGLSGGGAMTPGMTGGGGGGGFFRNMLGGMFGAAAGMWMYDNFFGSRGSSAFGETPGERFGGEGGDAGFGGHDTDAFTNDPGGGDSGGGFFGGGDSGGGGGGGGGDFGGGGGDSGGGDF